MIWKVTGSNSRDPACPRKLINMAEPRGEEESSPLKKKKREEKAAVLYRFAQELQLRYWCHLENCFAFLFSLSIVVNLCCITILFYLLFSLSQINLRLILVSGKTKEFLFSPSESAGDIAQFVFDNWPEGE